MEKKNVCVVRPLYLGKLSRQEDASAANREGPGPKTIYSNCAMSEEVLPCRFDNS